jgi:hypothetical protein
LHRTIRFSLKYTVCWDAEVKAFAREGMSLATLNLYAPRPESLDILPLQLTST